MKTKKTDRRSQRTQRLLGQALIALLLEKRYDHITIQDILDHADIGRATFYEHYWDKDDLLTSEIERVVNVLDQHITASSEHQEMALLPSLAFFQHVYEQYPLYHALLRGKGLEIATEAMQKHLRVQLEDKLAGAKNASAELRAAVAAYVVGAFITLLQWWLGTEMAWPPERIDTLFRDLVLPGVERLLFQDREAG